MASPTVVDTSAIVAISQDEPESEAFKFILDNKAGNFCSMVTFVESFMVLAGRLDGLSLGRHTALIADMGIVAMPMDQAQANAAAEAFLRFGKGRHPAKLNMGDCFSYALAKSLDAPLLFKGDDFVKTDILSATTTRARP